MADLAIPPGFTLAPPPPSGATPAATATTTPPPPAGAATTTAPPPPGPTTTPPPPEQPAAAPAVTQPQPSPTPPAAAPPPPQPNRTGLPPLAEIYERIDNDPALTSDETRRLARERATTTYNAMEADAARADRIRIEADQATVRAAENEIWKDTYSVHPMISATQIANDPRFDSNPEARKQMIDLVNNPPGTGVPAAQSYNAAQAIIDRIRLPEGDPNKITSRAQIYDQMHSLNRTDLEFTLKKFDDLSSPGENRFATRLEEFFRGITPQIDKSGVLPGLPNDAAGKAKVYEFRRFVEDKADQYRLAGKDPDQLLNPKSPDYLGSAEILKPYKRTLTQALSDFQGENQGPLGATQQDLSTPDKLKAAVANGTITREQGEAEALRRGWIQAPPPPQPAPVVPMQMR